MWEFIIKVGFRTVPLLWGCFLNDLYAYINLLPVDTVIHVLAGTAT